MIYSSALILASLHVSLSKLLVVYFWVGAGSKMHENIANLIQFW